MARLKLTTEDAENIRALHDWRNEQIERINNAASIRALAKKFDVSPRCIERILSFETHKRTTSA